ncbi:MAG: 2-alkenal reductase, partial [Rhodoferax sp.]|nr:2-alkenal reductase [Rhodoferax sp.]
MKRLWLLFSQTATVLLAAYFVVATLKPQWLGAPSAAARGTVVLQGPPADPGSIPAG